MTKEEKIMKGWKRCMSKILRFGENETGNKNRKEKKRCSWVRDGGGVVLVWLRRDREL